MPLDDEMITISCDARETRYAKEGDWIFASNRMKGRQPLWPEASCGITFVQQRNGADYESITWHVFRHTFSTLLAEKMKT